MAQDNQIPEAGEQKKTFPWARLLGTLLMVVLLVYLLVEHGWQELIQSFQSISWQYFTAALALMFISRLAVTARWHFLLRSVDIPIPFRESLRLTFAGLFSTNFLPTTVGGDLVRFLGAVQLKMDATICAASLIMDRLIGMIGMVLVLPIGVVQLLQGPLQSTFAPVETTLSAAFMGIKLDSLRQKVINSLTSLRQAIRLWMTRPKGLLLAMAGTAVHMLMIFMIVWLLFQGMGEHISLWMVAGIYSLSYLITLLPVSINGLGIQEVSLAYLYHAYGGVSMPSALALAILIRTLFMASSLPGAVFIPSLIQMRRSTQKS
jgi:uncharacterized membrane protein YbhN (UPF0104 family)